VLNKTDRVFEPAALERLARCHAHSVRVSSLTGEGIEDLKQAILQWLRPSLATRVFTIPARRGDLLNRLYEAGEVVHRDDTDDKTKLKVRGYPAVLSRVRQEITDALRASRAGAASAD